MEKEPKQAAIAVFLKASAFTFGVGIAATSVAGHVTHSGMLGICGPYGPHADLVGSIFFGSMPVSVGIGVYLARRTYRRLTK